MMENDEIDGGAAEETNGSGIALGICALILVCIGFGNLYCSRYLSGGQVQIPVRTFDSLSYPDDPSSRHSLHSAYNDRRIKLEQVDETHFDLTLVPGSERVAEIKFKGVDFSLMTPSLPEYCRGNRALRLISLTDREWNRQQVQFDVPGDYVEVTGGDGWEVENLKVASLAKNCLNAGLWEVLLFTEGPDGKELYYQGWFDFPIGQYKRLWELNTGLTYWNDLHFWRMEHWVDPEGMPIDVDLLREVQSMERVESSYDPDEAVWHAGEQLRKRRTSATEGVLTWGDFIKNRKRVRFATFRPPGVYDGDLKWGNRYELIAHFEGAVHQRVRSTLDGQEYDEIVLNYTSESGDEGQLFIGGLDLNSAPVVKKTEYHKGLYLPMGIGTPPFYQSYTELLENPPQESPYYSFFLNEQGEWIDHHSMAIDGPVIHRDVDDPDTVHLYLLSYERHQIVQHYVLTIPKRNAKVSEG